jgi:hypothetical protein
MRFRILLAWLARSQDHANIEESSCAKLRSFVVYFLLGDWVHTGRHILRRTHGLGASARVVLTKHNVESHHFCAIHARLIVNISNANRSCLNLQEAGSINLDVVPEAIHGGVLLASRAADHVAFYDWASQKCVRRIDVAAEALYWNTAGDMLALVTADSFYILKYDRDAVAEAIASGAAFDDDGLEDAFEVITEVCAAATVHARKSDLQL